MIHLLAQLLFAGLVVAIAAGLILGRKRAKHLARLDALLMLETAAPASGPRKTALPFLEKLLPQTIARNLRQLGVGLRPRDMVAGLTVLSFLCVAADVFAGAMAAAGLAAAVLLIACAAVNILAARRVTQLAGQLPGFLDRLRQLLAVGSSLPTAFARAVQGSQPLTMEFLEPAVRRVHNGAGFGDSIRQSAEDIDLHELQLFATTVTANTRFGGSLGQALSNLVLYLRRRAAIERELRASTAQIRASAWVLALLPLVVGLAIVVQNRDYAAWFFTHTAGHKLLIYCALSQAIGAVLMRLIVRTRF
jgi:tight adherence protein B